MRLLFIRHGQSEGNITEWVYGQDDLPLTELGKQQAQTTQNHVNRLVDGEITAVYASDLQRAIHTAEIVCPDFDVTTDARFREFDFGEATGEILSDYLEANPEIATTPTDPFPGGESAEELFNRVSAGVLDLVGRHDADDTLVVVMHSGPLECLYNFVNDNKIASDTPAIHTADVIDVFFDGSEFEICDHYQPNHP